MVASISSSFNWKEPHIEVSPEGLLYVEAQNQTYQVRLFSQDKPINLSTEQLECLQTFFTHFFQHSLSNSMHTKIKKLTIREEKPGHFKINLTQKDGLTSLIDKQELEVEDPDLHKIFSSTPSDKTILKLSKVHQHPWLHNLHKMFKGFVEFLFGKATPLSREIVEEFKTFVSHCPLELQKTLFRQLSRISDDERYLAHFLCNRLDFKNIDMDKVNIIYQILLGAYVIIEDEGQTYQEWFNHLQSPQQRISSHESDDHQYAVRGQLFKECLFSRKQVKKADGSTQTVTWFQLERYPSYSLLHLCSYLCYKISKMNQGPYGMSPHQEKLNPLVVTRLSETKREN